MRARTAALAETRHAAAAHISVAVKPDQLGNKWHSSSRAAECLKSDQGTARKIILYQPYRRYRVEHILIVKGAIRARSDPT